MLFRICPNHCPNLRPMGHLTSSPPHPSPLNPLQPSSRPQPVDRLACLLYGCLMLLAAASAASAYVGSGGQLLRLLLLRALRLVDAALRVGPLLQLAAQAARRVGRLAAVRAAVKVFESADRMLTDSVEEGLRGTLAVLGGVREAGRAASRVLAPLLRGLYEDVLLPLRRKAVEGIRTGIVTSRRAAVATYRRSILPAARALRAAFIAAYASFLRPLALMLAALLRRFVAPVLWPAGAVVSLAWFVRQALLQHAVLPYGAAAYVSALVVGLMAGKAMRKTGHVRIARIGTSLESLAAAAYLHLDPGVSRVMLKALHLAYGLAALAAFYALATGRWALALLSAPFFAALGFLITVLEWVLTFVVQVVAPTVSALRDAVVAVWRRPEASLVLSVAVLVAAYGAHVYGAPAAVWRASVWLVGTTGTQMVGFITVKAGGSFLWHFELQLETRLSCQPSVPTSLPIPHNSTRTPIFPTSPFFHTSYPSCHAVPPAPRAAPAPTSPSLRRRLASRAAAVWPFRARCRGHHRRPGGLGRPRRLRSGLPVRLRQLQHHLCGPACAARGAAAELGAAGAGAAGARGRRGGYVRGQLCGAQHVQGCAGSAVPDCCRQLPAAGAAGGRAGGAAGGGGHPGAVAAVPWSAVGGGSSACNVIVRHQRQLRVQSYTSCVTCRSSTPGACGSNRCHCHLCRRRGSGCVRRTGPPGVTTSGGPQSAGPTKPRLPDRYLRRLHGGAHRERHRSCRWIT
ncbi:hypothetical protein Agub_g9056 [Astrephomene gubernaculifera]|uniref:Transmembrane protein n=1 Tax=Astrephomene gubernaculifera TaxID=47775 RepID=A0AAD3DSS8_9CHLO|nr:hypothetical protein Agub_g9056 [Astrephomene gubernaculifera]